MTDNNGDDASTWGMDRDNDALTDAFPPHPFSFTSNVDVDALTHLNLLPCMTTDDDTLADTHLALLPHMTTDNNNRCDG